MSLKKYIEKKEKPNIIVSLDSYKESLISCVSSLILKPQNITESKKYIIDYDYLEKILSEMAYPFSKQIQMILKTGDVCKINQAHKELKSWIKNNYQSNNNSDFVDNAIYDYQSSLYQENITPDNIDKIFNSYLNESQKTMKLITNFISSKLEKIKNWNDHTIEIEALFPADGLIVNEAKVKIKHFDFDLEFRSPNFVVKNIKEIEMMPSLSENVNNLLSLLTENEKFEKILTLYMTRPTEERSFYESIKREISLGISSVLPNHLELQSLPIQENFKSDLWKVKVNSRYVCEKFIEGNYKQYEIINECPIRWIERIYHEE
jgi:hypothetical protein